jgi:hypothetical protein
MEVEEVYGKIFEQFFDSSVMEESVVTRYVFMGLITLSDQTGRIDVTRAALARRLNVSLMEIDEAIGQLSKEDPRSRSREWDGRRIIPIDEDRNWGWIVVNKDTYQFRKDLEEEREKARERKRQQRSRGVPGGHDPSRTVTSAPTRFATETETETDTETKTETESKPLKLVEKTRRGTRLLRGYQPEPSTVDWARKEVPGIDVSKAIEAFVDYWTAVGGRAGIKSDWDATFRNHVRDRGWKYAPPRGTPSAVMQELYMGTGLPISADVREAMERGDHCSYSQKFREWRETHGMPTTRAEWTPFEEETHISPGYFLDLCEKFEPESEVGTWRACHHAAA